MRDFLGLFKNKKPIIGMIHLKGENEADVLERAKKEIDIYIKNGLDGIILENYFGNYYQLEKIVKYVSESDIKIPFGINCLNFDAMGFYLANKYNADFIQIDSVVGHVKPRDEYTMEAFLKKNRKKSNAALLGGVRFKYQPILSENSVEEDLKIAMTRCDGICVTENATGEETSMEKIGNFRNVLGDFPLIVAAGVTLENIEKQMEICDAAIIGSYLKDTRKDDGEVSEKHVKEIVNKMNKIREVIK